MISLAANLGWPLFQLDVKNAFLNGDLKEELYMEQPPRFVAQGESGKVCRLHKAIYGLKQSLRTWFGKFSEVVLKFGCDVATEITLCFLVSYLCKRKDFVDSIC